MRQRGLPQPCESKGLLSRAERQHSECARHHRPSKMMHAGLVCEQIKRPFLLQMLLCLYLIAVVKALPHGPMLLLISHWHEESCVRSLCLILGCRTRHREIPGAPQMRRIFSSGRVSRACLPPAALLWPVLAPGLRGWWLAPPNTARSQHFSHFTTSLLISSSPSSSRKDLGAYLSTHRRSPCASSDSFCRNSKACRW